MNRKRLIAAALAGLLLSGCAAQASAPTAEETVTTEARPADPAPAYTLRDLDALYRNDNPESVTTMYLTVSDGAWAALNAQEAADGDLAGLLQIGDENGPLIGEIGYQETSANAAVRVSGDNAQKDYRITVDPGKGQWRGQSEIVLNKYQHDALRFGSKLVFDLLKDIPQAHESADPVCPAVCEGHCSRGDGVSGLRTLHPGGADGQERPVEPRPGRRRPPVRAEVL